MAQERLARAAGRLDRFLYESETSTMEPHSDAYLTSPSPREGTRDFFLPVSRSSDNGAGSSARPSRKPQRQAEGRSAADFDREAQLEADAKIRHMLGSNRSISSISSFSSICSLHSTISSSTQSSMCGYSSPGSVPLSPSLSMDSTVSGFSTGKRHGARKSHYANAQQPSNMHRDNVDATAATATDAHSLLPPSSRSHTPKPPLSPAVGPSRYMSAEEGAMQLLANRLPEGLSSLHMSSPPDSSAHASTSHGHVSRRSGLKQPFLSSSELKALARIAGLRDAGTLPGSPTSPHPGSPSPRSTASRKSVELFRDRAPLEVEPLQSYPSLPAGGLEDLLGGTTSGRLRRPRSRSRRVEPPAEIGEAMREGDRGHSWRPPNDSPTNSSSSSSGGNSRHTKSPRRSNQGSTPDAHRAAFPSARHPANAGRIPSSLSVDLPRGSHLAEETGSRLRSQLSAVTASAARDAMTWLNEEDVLGRPIMAGDFVDSMTEGSAGGYSPDAAAMASAMPRRSSSVDWAQLEDERRREGAERAAAEVMAERAVRGGERGRAGGYASGSMRLLPAGNGRDTHAKHEHRHPPSHPANLPGKEEGLRRKLLVSRAAAAAVAGPSPAVAGAEGRRGSGSGREIEGQQAARQPRRQHRRSLDQQSQQQQLELSQLLTLRANAMKLMPKPAPKPSDHVLGIPYQSIHERYRLSASELGQGQFGSIRTCLELATGRGFACKTIVKKKILLKEDAEDVRREVAILSLFKGHESIIDVHEVYEDEREVNIVMELCAGGDLFDRTKERDQICEESAAAIIRALTHAVMACHAKGVIHRDIKPENVLMCSRTEDTSIKLIDFGISTFFEHGE